LVWHWDFSSLPGGTQAVSSLNIQFLLFNHHQLLQKIFMRRPPTQEVIAELPLLNIIGIAGIQEIHLLTT
jgi:hypothetical protein